MRIYLSLDFGDVLEEVGDQRIQLRGLQSDQLFKLRLNGNWNVTSYMATLPDSNLVRQENNFAEHVASDLF
jgi:hypothetical protein